jgi:hypothetical protein
LVIHFSDSDLVIPIDDNKKLNVAAYRNELYQNVIKVGRREGKGGLASRALGGVVVPSPPPGSVEDFQRTGEAKEFKTLILRRWNKKKQRREKRESHGGRIS